MADTTKFTSTVGTVEFDFDNKKVVFDRNGAFAGSMHLTSMTIDFASITEVEMRAPKMLKAGAFCSKKYYNCKKLKNSCKTKKNMLYSFMIECL